MQLCPQYGIQWCRVRLWHKASFAAPQKVWSLLGVERTKGGAEPQKVRSD